MLNQPPEVELTPEPPIREIPWLDYLKGDNTTKISITSIDPDDTKDTCEIFPFNDTILKKVYESHKFGTNEFEWNLVLKNDIKASYTLKVRGEKGLTERNITITPYTILDFIYIPLVGNIFVFLSGCLVAILADRRKTISDSIKSWLNCILALKKNVAQDRSDKQAATSQDSAVNTDASDDDTTISANTRK